MSKRERQEVIRKVVDSMTISSQEMLLQILVKRGVDVTQATLSRDIKELKIIKAPVTDGGYSYQLSESDDRKVGSSFVGKSIEFSGNLAVLKTRPGYAMAIAGEIDHMKSKEILGTVAGDDTILLVIRENISREEVLKALSKIIEL